MHPFALAFPVAVWALPLSAGPVAITDATDRQIVEAFLEHVRNSAVRCTPERLAQYAAQPEDITWQGSRYIKMALVAYELTGDAAYLDMFVQRMDALCQSLEEGPDGFLGWYGLPLELFRHPEHPERQVDVMLTSFVVAGLIADFARVIQADDVQEQRLADAARRFLELAQNHLVKKWDARGRYKDLGDGGAVYITHAELKPVKASLTQPHNKHSKIIKALISLYAATGEDEYVVRAIKLGTRFKRCLTLVGDHYTWNYWDPAGAWDIDPDEPRSWKHWIGSEHRGGYYSSSAWQAVVLYEHGLVFSRADIDRFVRTQVDVCWNGDFGNPTWARVDGRAADAVYLCSALAPFEASVYRMAFGPPAQAARLAGKDHSWQGGPVASDWLELKYAKRPRWRGAQPAEAEAISAFLAKAENRAVVEQLSFEVTAPGYKAPTAPAQMIDIPGGQQ